jgi:hypothetical protein
MSDIRSRNTLQRTSHRIEGGGTLCSARYACTSLVWTIAQANLSHPHSHRPTNHAAYIYLYALICLCNHSPQSHAGDSAPHPVADGAMEERARSPQQAGQRLPALWPRPNGRVQGRPARSHPDANSVQSGQTWANPIPARTRDKSRSDIYIWPGYGGLIYRLVQSGPHPVNQYIRAAPLQCTSWASTK